MNSDDLIDFVSKSLRLAWSQGQLYWQQADSDSSIQNRKSDETQRKFDALVEDVRAALAQSLTKGDYNNLNTVSDAAIVSANEPSQS